MKCKEGLLNKLVQTYTQPNALDPKLSFHLWTVYCSTEAKKGKRAISERMGIKAAGLG